jgi:hypothetical protein
MCNVYTVIQQFGVNLDFNRTAKFCNYQNWCLAVNMSTHANINIV